MARLREERAPAPRRHLAALATATVLAVAIGAAALAGWHRAERIEAARLAAARAEQLRLERELATIKELTAGLQPVVYVGSTPEYDVYIDLDVLRKEPAGAANASYRPSRPGV
ncbi:MAG TPA: hypothetical protein VGF40_15525 [Thermoanaerobaculia bacterium]